MEGAGCEDASLVGALADDRGFQAPVLSHTVCQQPLMGGRAGDMSMIDSGGGAVMVPQAWVAAVGAQTVLLPSPDPCPMPSDARTSYDDMSPVNTNCGSRLLDTNQETSASSCSTARWRGVWKVVMGSGGHCLPE